MTNIEGRLAQYYSYTSSLTLLVGCSFVPYVSTHWDHHWWFLLRSIISFLKEVSGTTLCQWFRVKLIKFLAYGGGRAKLSSCQPLTRRESGSARSATELRSLLSVFLFTTSCSILFSMLCYLSIISLQLACFSKPCYLSIIYASACHLFQLALGRWCRSVKAIWFTKPHTLGLSLAL